MSAMFKNKKVIGAADGKIDWRKARANCIIKWKFSVKHIYFLNRNLQLQSFVFCGGR